jgi:hypothetical protein
MVVRALKSNNMYVAATVHKSNYEHYTIEPALFSIWPICRPNPLSPWQVYSSTYVVFPWGRIDLHH